MLEADSAPREPGGIREVLASLDRATREFTRRLEELAALGASPERTNGDGPQADDAEPSAEAGSRGEPEARFTRAQLDLEQRMSEAEADAQRYLDDAKQRADAMVESIVTAVEAEADAMHRGAEQGVRARWGQAEAEAERFLDDARRAADGLVTARRRRISELSDTIVGLAEVLTERMADAERIKREFDSLVVALAEAAGRLATGPESVARPRPASSAVGREMGWSSGLPGFDIRPGEQARAA